MLKKILGAKIILENQVLENYGLLFDEEILDILPEEELKGISALSIQHNGYISPGFIDIHIHGSGGCDAMDGDLEGLKTISNIIVRGGTTSFLPTTMTMETEVVKKALDTIREFMKGQEEDPMGSRALGVHLEGPFISPKHHGAQNPVNIQKPNDKWLKDYYDIVKIITLAPEEDFGYQMIKEWSSRGIVCSCGHTDATYEQMEEALHAGAKHVTHIFNAMTPLKHRQPGAVGAALNLEGYKTEIITDGFHVHPNAVNIVCKHKGPDKTLLITDSMRAGYLGDGESELGGQKVTVSGCKCLLTDGTIAGSIHRQDAALRNVMKWTNLPLYEVVRMLTMTPARSLQVEHRKGSIAIGKDADLVCLSNDFEVEQVYVSGVEQLKK